MTYMNLVVSLIENNSLDAQQTEYLNEILYEFIGLGFICGEKMT